MTGKEVVQALRCCAKGLGHDDACENCKVGEIQDRREYIEFAAANVIERLTAENAALREKVPQWISVEDRLPADHLKRYLIAFKDAGGSIVDAARYIPGLGWECCNCGNGKVVGEFLCDEISNITFGWHISNLRIYDTPRELREFYAVPNEVEVALKAKPKPITRPPQSWRYVEEETWND